MVGVVTASKKLKAPFPWFGGKRRVAHIVWERFGDVPNYVEPFAGSLAVLLCRPHTPRNETVNDLDCHIANFWRALREDPEGVAQYADWPVNEADLHARHQWLHGQEAFRERMHTDPDHYDVKVAGWWVWGISSWIGDNWCRTKRQDSRPEIRLNKGVHRLTQDGTGLDRRRPNIGIGEGVNRQHARRPTLKKGGTGVQSERCTGSAGQHMKMPHFKGNRGTVRETNLLGYFYTLADRLRRVRVCCGEWHRICGPSPTVHIGTTAVFLDPPYGVDDRDKVYSVDCLEIADVARQWCLEHGDNVKLRIALCGYAGEHDSLEAMGWECVPWKAAGGYGSRNADNQNANRERIWFSPHCLKVGLF